MASNSNKPQATEEKPAEFIANESTQTIYGVTLGHLVSEQAREMERLGNVAKEKEATIKTKDAEIAKLTADLKAANDKVVASETLIGALRPFRTLTKFEDGSVRLPVTLDADCAGRYFDQAEGAQEDPELYISKQVEEALLAFSNS